MTPANDNNAAQDWKRCKSLNNGWDQYDKIEMTRFGPIGILKGRGFVYLDPEIAAWRSQ